MKQGLRWVVTGLAGVLVVVVAIWAASRLWGVSAQQRAALAQMRSEWMPAGRNGFDALWTLQHDVPVAQQRAVMEADRRAILAWPPFGAASTNFRSKATAYPDLKPSAADREKSCAASKPGCLAMVSADIDGYAALVERNATLIARADALGGYDYIKLLLPTRVDTPLPAFVDTYLPATRDALLFAQGRQQEALANVCRGIASWRRYAGNSDMLIASMVATAYAADGYGGLFADMLAAMPADAPIPQQCRVALGEVRPAELSLCEAMKGEFAFGDRAMRDLSDAPDGEHPAGSRLARRLLFDAEGTSAMNAANMAAACDARVEDMIARDVPVRSAWGERKWRDRFACIGNALGCMLGDIAAPAYANYFHRRQDFGMKLRLLGTLQWLHEHPLPGASLAQRLQQRPAQLKSPAREIVIGEDGKRLAIRLHEASKGDWSQPLRR